MCVEKVTAAHLCRPHPLSGIRGDVDMIYKLINISIAEVIINTGRAATVFQDVRTNKPSSIHQTIVEWICCRHSTWKLKQIIVNQTLLTELTQ